jgi:hypothetical protein
VTCSFQKCQAPCTSNPSGMECRTCQTAMGCLSAFFTCAGITPPTPGTDGGPATDATTDAPPDGGADGVGDVNTGGPDRPDAADTSSAG